MRSRILCTMLALLGFVSSSQSQVATGVLPFNSYGGGPFDSVNLGNLNVHFTVPVLHKAGRGMAFAYDLNYDSSIYQPVVSNGTTSWQPSSQAGSYGSYWGWQKLALSTPYVNYTTAVSSSGTCYGNQTWYVLSYTNYVYYDAFGTGHPFPGVGGAQMFSPGPPGCPTSYTSEQTTGKAGDGSGYSISIGGVGGSTATVSTSGGTSLSVPQLTGPPTGPSPYNATDNNGNEITFNNTNGTFTDTLNQAVLVETGTAPNPVKFSYIPPANESSGTRVPVTVNFKNYTVQTNFNATDSNNHAIAEYRATAAVALVDNVTLPDGTKYQFQYEATPSTPSSGQCTPLSGTTCTTGRIASVTLPTGGTITYTYSGGSNGIYNDGSTAGLDRILAASTTCNSSNGCWQYSRSLQSGTPGPGSTWQTTVIDPNSNYTVLNFAEDGTTNTSTTQATYGFYLTERQAYQGSVSPSNLLATVIECYNANYASCSTASVNSPITQTDVYGQLPNGNTRLSETLYNGSYTGSGLVSDDKEYDYGVSMGSAPGTAHLIRETAATYASLGNNIIDRLGTILVYDWTSGSSKTVASTAYTYDESTPTSPSGTTPQHISITGSRGNLTTLAAQVNSSTVLYRKFTYYDTGSLYTATDAGTTSSGGPNVTTYNYPDATSTCGNAFATTVTLPILGTTPSTTFDCVGAVAKQTKDLNGNPTNITWNDSFFWRPAISADPLGNQTNFNYGSTWAQSWMTFNSSIVDAVTEVDGFGRTSNLQSQEKPNGSNYDTVTVGYDSVGRQSLSTVPCVAALWAQCPNSPGTTTSYDALDRPVQIMDGGGGKLNYTYTQNDVLQVLGPQPSGENVKQKQFEYDGLGRLVSVCEITTTANGGGNCAQTSAQTGLWTKYSYDVLGHITGVTQNAQAATGSQQTRSYAFDMVGRLTSETNPENGTTTYVYDTNSTGSGACASYGFPSYPGDLVARYDAKGNAACYQYDALHRVMETTYYGPDTTPSKHFNYDYGYFGSTLMANPKGRLVEAYTCTAGASTCVGNVITDELFSYSARGELTDIWECTPHSGSSQCNGASGGYYYHVNATYWPHGLLNVLNGGTNPLPGLPVITYGASNGTGLDGKGRITSVTAASGQGPVSSVSWNASNQITGVTFGSGDGDTYQYDPNTGRMTQYKLMIGSSSQTGGLTWNANSTLQKLQITDTLNSADNQTCAYGYDDLTRITSANCGSAWSQTFGFDPFGNLSKSGSAQFLPTYTGASGTGTVPSNQYYQISGGGAGTSNYYDANGNLKNDITHTYTWDAAGNMLSVDGSTVTMIYDALDRMAEQTSGSSHTEIAYAPSGMKLALMNGQTLVDAFVKLPGGGRAVYNSSGLAYYRHPDYLGNSRLATKTTKGLRWYQAAYAPYGEEYAKAGDNLDLAFTDENQDTVGNGWSANLYDFMSREYRTAHGRWTSPDPAGLASANPANPQSWNRYAYVLNNPLSLVDPLGLAPCNTMSGGWECYDPSIVGGGQTGGCNNECAAGQPNLGAMAGGIGACAAGTACFQTQMNTYTTCIVANACGWYPVPGEDASKPHQEIWVTCSGTYSGSEITSVDCGAPSQALPGSQAYIYNAPVDWSQALHDPIFSIAANTMNKVTAGYAIAFGTVAGGSLFSELALASDSTAITDPLIANSDKVLGQTDLYHNFGELVGNEAMQNGELAVQNGSYLQWNIPGAINGAAGVFQYGGLLSPTGGVLYVTHTLFQGQ